ncbi:CBS domain protein [Natranaerovirga hydrolytica]|uniref:CBS domain protein n=1 Tax=Natranaerovirga hydrolytica TaxID=680378 RepID=A0A4R1M6D9_9FIRM|nr:CBS domain-containing protein [Natranaerovirga hydrolytica]TCK86760.1 CBS domain protein [Natranaerovirga hydrolytica]
MDIKEIMTTNIVSVPENTSLKDIAKKMSDTGVGSILVIENNALNGIITDRDIVTRGLASDKDINTLTACDVMTKNVITASINEDLDHVIDLMSDHQVKRIPIMDSNEVKGVVSLGDMSQTYILEDDAGEVLHDITEKSFNQ